MNILTYASPVGIRPQRVWCISVYRKTLSHSNFMQQRSGVLQVLSEEHAPLTHLLGGQSGREVDKAEGCRDLGFGWHREGFVEESLLPGCLAYLRLNLLEVVSAGDHDVAVCSVEKILVPTDAAALSNARPMQSAFLREKGLISNKGQAVPPDTN
ncbi:unnamed protein product [Prorocentrum cordatum]|uniref:Flavin reductase like domain-containing protein n=1 Tax=Prorocentrum cordatum TaxID=2364126 RepID=A0ABN9VPS6_9DINO|nr:unnamed protein product [Polarella glacialis]